MYLFRFILFGDRLNQYGEFWSGIVPNIPSGLYGTSPSSNLPIQCTRMAILAASQDRTPHLQCTHNQWHLHMTMKFTTHCCWMAWGLASLHWQQYWLMKTEWSYWLINKWQSMTKPRASRLFCFYCRWPTHNFNMAQSGWQCHTLVCSYIRCFIN